MFDLSSGHVDWQQALDIASNAAAVLEKVLPFLASLVPVAAWRATRAQRRVDASVGRGTAADPPGDLELPNMSPTVPELRVAELGIPPLGGGLSRRLASSRKPRRPPMTKPARKARRRAACKA